MLFLLAPALIAQAPAIPARKLEVLLDQLKAVGEATVQGRDSLAKIKAEKAARAWGASREDIADLLDSETMEGVETQFSRMKDAAIAESALAAMDASELLARAAREGRPRLRMAAERACVRAFLMAKASRWSEMPDLPSAFNPLMSVSPRKKDVADKTKQVLQLHGNAVTLENPEAASKAAQILFDSISLLEP